MVDLWMLMCINQHMVCNSLEVETTLRTRLEVEQDL